MWSAERQAQTPREQADHVLVTRRSRQPPDSRGEPLHAPYDNALRQHTVQRLRTKQPLFVHLLVAQSVLRRTVGGLAVVVDQLLGLLNLRGLPNVIVQVVPDGINVCTSFTIMSFPEERFDDVTYIEQLHTTTWLEHADDRKPYERMFVQLAKAARPPEDSWEHIADALHHLQDQDPLAPAN